VCDLWAYLLFTVPTLGKLGKDTGQEAMTWLLVLIAVPMGKAVSVVMEDRHVTFTRA